MSSITINKLLKTSPNSNDSKNFIYLRVKWDDEKFDIILSDSETGKSYQGVVNVSALKEIASNLNMSYNDYYGEIRSALSTYLALPGFYYKLEPEILNVWKSQPESIPILFLDIELKEIISKFDLLDSAIELLQQQDKSLTDRVQKAYKFDEHSRELLQDYRLCVEEKKELERKLFKKAALLLNAKKKRISQLEQRLKKYENLELNSGNADSDRNEVHTSKKRRLVVDSDTENEYMADTEPLNSPRNDI